MAESTHGRVARIVRSIRAGDATAAEQLLPIIYDELRTLGRALMAHVPPGNCLRGRALVHEAYVRLVAAEDRDCRNRNSFFAAAAQAMRRIMVEQARRKAPIRHGGGHIRHAADEFELTIAHPTADVLALDRSLERLREKDARKADIVELRFFAGLTIQETGAVIGVSKPTVERDWRFSRAFLYDELSISEEC